MEGRFSPLVFILIGFCKNALHEKFSRTQFLAFEPWIYKSARFTLLKVFTQIFVVVLNVTVHLRLIRKKATVISVKRLFCSPQRTQCLEAILSLPSDDVCELCCGGGRRRSVWVYLKMNRSTIKVYLLNVPYTFNIFLIFIFTIVIFIIFFLLLLQQFIERNHCIMLKFASRFDGSVLRQCGYPKIYPIGTIGYPCQSHSC